MLDISAIPRPADSFDPGYAGSFPDGAATPGFWAAFIGSC